MSVERLIGLLTKAPVDTGPKNNSAFQLGIATVKTAGFRSGYQCSFEPVAWDADAMSAAPKDFREPPTPEGHNAVT